MLDAVLIENKTERATAHKANLAKSVIYLNGFKTLLAAAGLTPTIADMQTVSHKLINSLDGSRWLHKFVIDALAAQAGAQSFGGVALSPEKVKEMIAVPSLTAIENHVLDNAFFLSNYAFEPELLEVVAGIVQAKATANATIDNKYKYFTKNDRGAEVATKLFDMAASLNAYKDYVAASVGSDKIDTADLTVLGLKMDDGVYKPSLQFIRNQEKCYPDYVAE